MRMKVPAYFVPLSFSMFLLASMTAASTAAASQTPSATGLYLFCSSDPDGPVIYFSDIFIADPDPSTSGMRGVSFRTTAHAFLVFLQQKYSFKSGSNYPTGCANAVNSPTGLSYAQTHKQQMEDQYKQGKKQIVETGWKYTPGEGVAAPAPTPPARLHH
jgi:hypothetical protein